MFNSNSHVHCIPHTLMIRANATVAGLSKIYPNSYALHCVWSCSMMYIFIINLISESRDDLVKNRCMSINLLNDKLAYQPFVACLTEPAHGEVVCVDVTKLVRVDLFGKPSKTIQKGDESKDCRDDQPSCVEPYTQIDLE